MGTTKRFVMPWMPFEGSFLLIHFPLSVSQHPIPMTAAEKQLLKSLRNPETRRQAFEELVRLYQEPLYYTVRRVVMVHEDADDVLQSTFLKAWQGLDNFRGESSLGTWLHRIASNEALDLLEGQRRKGGSLDDEAGASQALLNRLESDPYFDGDETELQLQQAVAQLPAKQRLVFTMKYFDEMKYEEISDVLGTSVGALKASYHHAVQKIATFFGMQD